MKRILSLFDHSGNWPAFYADAGHEVHCMDLKNELPVDARDWSVEWFVEKYGIDWVDGIFLAPMCRDFASSGAQYWPAKDADGRSAASVELVRQGLRAVEFWQPDFWVLENPVGRLARMVPELGKPALIFDPCDYAGWLDLSAADLARLDVLRARNGLGEWSQDEVDFVKACNAYSKRSCLWGKFRLPEKRRIEPVKVCKQGSWLQRLGGSGEKVKELRSESPLGFALAFFAANDWSGDQEAENLLERMLEYAREHGPNEVEAEFGFESGVSLAKFEAAIERRAA